MGPRRVHLFFLINTGFSKIQVAFFDVWKWTEDVFLNHLHDLVQVRNDHTDDVFLVLKHLLELSNRVESLRLALHVLLLVFVVVGLHAHLQLFNELLLGVLVDDSAGIATSL